MRARTTWLGLVFLAACATRDASVVARDPLHEVGWNDKAVAVGVVQALVELESDTSVFSNQGVTVFAGGEVVGSNHSVTRWRSAAVVMAPDRGTRWVVASDADGELWRVRDRSRLERVRDRFSLADHRIARVVGAPSGKTLFVTEDGLLASVEGSLVKLHPLAGAADSLVAAGPGAALVERDRIVKLDVVPTAYPLKEVAGVAMDDEARLFAIRSDSAYVQRGEKLSLLHRSTEPLRGLVGAGTQAWAIEGSSLVSLRHDTPPVRYVAPNVGAEARLFGGANGDVWIYDRAKLVRFSEARPRDASQVLFERACAKCHGVSAPSGIDLSTLAIRARRRDELRQRVIVDRTMPPVGEPPLGDAERHELVGN